jgi:hypothetical protein
VIRLYIFCSKLEKHLQDTFAQELREWNAPTETTLQNLMWRSPEYVRKRRQSEAESSTSSSDDPMDAGFDDDRLIMMEVMAWRNEVVEPGNLEGSQGRFR